MYSICVELLKHIFVICSSDSVFPHTNLTQLRLFYNCKTYSAFSQEQNIYTWSYIIRNSIVPRDRTYSLYHAGARYVQKARYFRGS